MEDWVIEAHDLTKVYQMGEVEVHALRGLSIQVERGAAISIMGPSGSGKSTLMNIIGCLDRPTSGEYILDGERVSDLKDDQLASIRNRKVGFVFQVFNLLPRATALANVELPMRYAGVAQKRREKARQALTAVGLGDRLNHLPKELSGGERQRVAIARALVTSPEILLADEPTGNLDTKTAQAIYDLFEKLNEEEGLTVIVATHNPKLGSQAKRVIYLKDGKVVSKETSSL